MIIRALVVVLVLFLLGAMGLQAYVGAVARDGLEAALAQSAKQTIRVAGPVEVRLFPNPEITAAGVTVGESTIASAEKVRLRLKLAPLLAGRREIEGASLTGGRIGPVEGISASLAPDGALRAEGKLGSDITLAFTGWDVDGVVDGEISAAGPGLSAKGMLSLSAQGAALPDLAITAGSVAARANIVVQNRPEGLWAGVSLAAAAPGIQAVATGEYRGGKLILAPVTMDLYGLHARGEASMDANGMRARLKAMGLDLAFAARPDAGGIALDDIQALWKDIRLGGTARLDLGRRALSAHLTAPGLALGPWLAPEAKSGPLKSLRLENLDIQLTATEAETVVERLTGRLLGGTLAAAGRGNAAGVAASLSLRGADIAPLGLGAGGLKASKGRLDADFGLSGRGHSLETWRPSMAGSGKLIVRDGVIDGFDLAAMDAQAKRADSLNGLLGLIQTGLSGGSSRFSSLSASFKIDKGVMDSRDITLAAEGGTGEGTAEIDLGRETVDARFALKLASGSPPAGIRLRGPWAGPVKSVDLNALQHWLAERGAGKALKGKGAGLLEQMGLKLKPRTSKD